MTLKTGQQSSKKERSRLVTPQSLKVMAIVVKAGSLTLLPPSPSIGNNFLLIFSLYYQDQETRSFEGAPEFAFSAVIRINLESTEAVDNWLKKMMETSLCTYRVSRGGHKPVGKRILCKHEMHCQHSRKALTPKQIQKSAAAKAKKLRKPLCTLARDKKTQCPSTLTLSLQVPTKKQKRAAEQHPYLLSHRAVLKLDFIHNHPIHAAHPLSFRPISEKTKQQFLEYFDKGHCASSARHTHEQMLILNSETCRCSQTNSAGRSYN